ncbi:transmembrane and ubiquitin-like domain-containing 1 [Brachionus plicatilis]|uniref:Transmembrane and ubiquitin-like domain-containing 1 n=1 Tax=Brachionus plicatilis TaxID=10195 RepID=A0A3M7RFZ0_BRAPC|nr:transmembrane and ubiquitin-like domain-containing 1 [Brachionus plicatilis]
MTLMDSIGSELISILVFSLTITIIALSWFSTSVREFPFSANLLIIERRSRRLYTTSNLNGNLRVQSQQTNVDTLNNQETITLNSNANSNINSIIDGQSTSNSSRNNFELVNEIVEQTLVENLLEGNFYTSQNLNLEMLSQNSLGINSGNGQASTLMNRNSDITLNQSETSPSENTLPGSDELINILIKFVNEKEKRIQVRQSDTILLFKKTHFSNELSNNKIVRFIYQGQFLEDKHTFKSYNIKDQTTIHCNIISKPNDSNQTSPIQSSEETENRAPNDNSDQSNQQSLESETSNQNNDYGQNVLFNIELNHFLLPMLAIVLGTCWYIRLNFKHLFSPLSSLFLIIFTFLYAIFLINNLQSSSNVPVSTITVRRRIVRLDDESERAPANQTVH